MRRRDRRLRRWRGRLVVAALGVSLAVTACGGDDDDTIAGDDPPAVDDASEGTGDGEAGTEEPGEPEGAVTEGLPDPCTMLAPDELTGLLGADPGTGTLQAPVPDQRKICMFTNGTILAVEVSDNWEASLDLIRDQFGADALDEVAGVGHAAYWQETGSQFIALDDAVFVGVTGPIDQATARSVAEAMLAAA